MFTRQAFYYDNKKHVIHVNLCYIMCLLDHEISELQAENRSIKQQIRGKSYYNIQLHNSKLCNNMLGKYILLGYLIFPK